MAAGQVGEGGFQDGRVVDVRTAPERPLYLVGDVHARHQVIPLILEHAELEPLLATERAFLVFLGDLHHREDYEGAGEMESSVETFRLFMRLKTQYPRSVYALLGNHEFTRSGSTKRGYFQGDLFREALVAVGLADTYQRFLELSPLVVIHATCVGVHAGPSIDVESLEALKQVQIRDVPLSEMERAVRRICFSRHRDWSPNPEKHYDDHDVRDFLDLCQVPDSRLITGHTPLDRETDWMWDIGKHLTVIFAAGRDVGYFRATQSEQRFLRVGRYTGEEFQVIKPYEEPGAGLVPVLERGRSMVRIDEAAFGRTLAQDVEYLWDYPGRAVELSREGEKILTIAHFRHLQAFLQSYYAMGYYLVADALRQEVLKLRIELATLLGGDGLREGVRFSWGDEEFGIIRWLGEDSFVFRPLVQGLSLE
jgi:calcineurin-like phosphoesterase family protein